MEPQEFVNSLQAEEISAAIKAAEQKTSGELRVFVSKTAVDHPIPAAEAEFAALGMQKTKDRNAVLIFVAPASQTFAIVGDSGIHSRCGNDFWSRLTEEMTVEFKAGRFTEGILRAVHTAGDILARHFPLGKDDKNELPDDVRFDSGTPPNSAQ